MILNDISIVHNDVYVRVILEMRQGFSSPEKMISRKDSDRIILDRGLD